MLRVLAWMLLGSIAYAENLDAREQATLMKDLGVQAMQRNDYSAALENFERAFALFPTANLKFDRAMALMQLKRPAEACDLLDQFLDENPGAPEAQQRFARKTIRALERELGSATVTSDVSGAEVIVDGQARGTTPLKLRLSIGERSVEARKLGFMPVSQPVKIKKGEMRKLHFRLQKP